MGCNGIDNLLMQSRNRRPVLNEAALEHLRTCDRCSRLVAIWERPADSDDRVDPDLLERIKGSILPDLRPVRPIAPVWMLTTILIVISGMVAWTGGEWLGLAGMRVLHARQKALIYPAIGFFIWLAAECSVRQIIPGLRQRIGSTALLTMAGVTLIIIFALLFHNYTLTGFWPEGIRCLVTGVAFALPTALAAWLALSRGFAVDPVVASIGAGILAGLTGIAVLELHCPNLKAMHLLVWHVAVLPASAVLCGIGAALKRFT